MPVSVLGSSEHHTRATGGRRESFGIVSRPDDQDHEMMSLVGSKHTTGTSSGDHFPTYIHTSASTTASGHGSMHGSVHTRSNHTAQSSNFSQNSGSTDSVTSLSYNGKEMDKLQTTLEKINFHDLEESIPWTASMEIEVKKSDAEDRVDFLPDPQAPFNNGELSMLRRMMNRQKMELFSERAAKMIHEHDPDLAKDRTVRGIALRKIKEKELCRMTNLSEDTFSFLISSKLFSTPWFLGAGTLLLKVRIYYLFFQFISILFLFNI